MLKIWGRNNSVNVQKALWCCDELGIKYERIDAGGQFGVVNDPKYLALNPNKLVPTIDDEGFILWESNAIVRYVASKHGKGSLYPDDLKQRAEADKWMDWQATTVWPNLRTVFWGLVRTPPAERDMKAIEAAIKNSGKALAILDTHLANRNYVAGASLTMGDIPVGCAVYRWMELDIKRPPLKNLEAWYARLCSRPAFKKNVMIGLT